MKKVLFAFAALIALTSGRACSRSAKLKQVWLCSCLLAALAASSLLTLGKAQTSLAMLLLTRSLGSMW